MQFQGSSTICGKIKNNIFGKFEPIYFWTFLSVQYNKKINKMENYILNPNSNFANSHSGICFLWMCLFKWDRVLFLGSIEPVDIAWKQVLHVAYLSFISGGWKWFQIALLREDLPPEMMDKKKFKSKNYPKRGQIFRRRTHSLYFRHV